MCTQLSYNKTIMSQHKTEYIHWHTLTDLRYVEILSEFQYITNAINTGPDLLHTQKHTHYFMFKFFLSFVCVNYVSLYGNVRHWANPWCCYFGVKTSLWFYNNLRPGRWARHDVTCKNLTFELSPRHHVPCKDLTPELALWHDNTCKDLTPELALWHDNTWTNAQTFNRTCYM